MQQYLLPGVAALVAGVHVSLAHGAIYEEVEFPLGDVSFADAVVTYTPGAGVLSPHNDPAAALGVPDYVSTSDDRYASLGPDGTLIVRFDNNVLIDQDEVEDGRDLYIFEIGPQVESFHVAISVDGENFIEIGTLAGQPTGIDIKPFVAPGQEFRYVRLIDTGNNRSGSPFAGADIDAIGAIGAVEIPEPASLLMAAGGGAAVLLRRRR